MPNADDLIVEFMNKKTKEALGEKIDTKNVNNSGEYTLRIIISYIDENGKKVNLKKETMINIQSKV